VSLPSLFLIENRAGLTVYNRCVYYGYMLGSENSIVSPMAKQRNNSSWYLK